MADRRLVEPAWDLQRVRVTWQDREQGSSRADEISTRCPPGADDQDRHMIGTLLGHSQAQTTHRYTHLADDPVKMANEKAGTPIEEMMKPGRAVSQ